MFWKFKSLTWEKNAFIYSFTISCHIFFKSYSFSFLILPGFSLTSLPTKLQILSPSFSLKYGMLHKFGCHPCTWAMLIFSLHGFNFCFMCRWREQSITSFFSGKERCHRESVSSPPTWSTGPLEVRLSDVSWSAAGIRPSCPPSSYSSQLPFNFRNLWGFSGSRAFLEGRILA